MTDPKLSITLGAKDEATPEVQKLKKELEALGQVKAFEKLKRDTLAAEKEWRAAQRRVADLAREMRSGGPAAGKVAREFEQAKRQAASLKQAYLENRDSLHQMRKALVDTGVDTRKLGDAQKKLQKQVDDTKKVLLARSKLGIDGWRDTRTEIGKLRAAYATLKRSGTATSADLARAKVNLRRQTAELTRETGLWANAMTNVRYGIVALAAAGYGFLQHFSGRAMAEAEKAMFNLESSVRAANREFDNVGSVEEWGLTIQRLSGELKIYSETALKNAVSRTVDMTKRLGLSKDQMEEVIRRSADLGAGKVELEGAIERVTAAMRGEAESAEYLGLTLNENYVKAWYEANAATEKAWKDLNDLEKAQVRYQLFLEQTNELQGRAAASVTTFGGAVQQTQAAITDAITKNEDLRQALKDMADTLRANSDEIGDAIADIVGLSSKVIQLALDYRGLIAAMVGGYAAVKTFKAIRAGIDLVRAGAFLSWTTQAAAGLKAIAASGGLAATALKAGVAGAAIAAGAALGTAIYQGYQAVKAYRMVKDSQERMIATSDRALAKLEKFKDVRLPRDFLGKAPDEIKQLQWELLRARDYYSVLINRMKATGETKGLADAEDRLRTIRTDLERIGNAAKESFEKPAEAIQATTEQLDEFEKKAKSAYEDAKAEAEKYAAEIEKINQRIADRQVDTEDKIRELKRANLSDEEQAADIRLQAIEKIQAANAALARYQSEDSEDARDDAKKFFDDAARLWERYAGQGEEATSEAISGLEQVKSGLDALDKAEIGWIERMKKQAEDMAAGIEAELEQLTRDRQANIDIELRRLEEAQAAINDLTRDETKHIYVTMHQRTVEEHAAGGRVGLAAAGAVAMARGGRFPGNSKIDSIHVMARPGEGFVRNEALSVWDRLFGPGFFEGVNAPWSRMGQSIIAALKGSLPSTKLPATVLPRAAYAFAAGGRVTAPEERMVLELTAGGVSAPLTVVGDRQSIRAAVKGIEKEIRKMGLSHSPKGTR